MPFSVTDWRRNSSNWIRVYVEDTDTNTQPTDATATCTLRRSGAIVFTARAMTYISTVAVRRGFTPVGCYRVEVTPAESVRGSYAGTITVTKAGKTSEDTFTATII